MSAGVITNIVLFGVSILLNLVGFIVGNMFIKRIDKLTESFEKMAEKLEQYVRIQDHKEDLGEIKKRIEKLEDYNSHSGPINIKRS